MINVEAIAKAGYEVYKREAAEAGMKSVPAWERLTPRSRKAWIAAVAEILNLHRKAMAA